MTWFLGILAVYATVVATLEAVFLIRAWLEKRAVRLDVKTSYRLLASGHDMGENDVIFIAENTGKTTIQIEYVGYRLVGGSVTGPKVDEFVYLSDFGSDEPLPYRLHAGQTFYAWKDIKELAMDIGPHYGLYDEAEIQAFYEDDEHNKYVSKTAFRIHAGQVLV